MKSSAKKHTYSTLITDLSSLIEQGRKTAVRYINTALVATYWLMGKRIVEYEQKGKERAEYGEALLWRLSEDLTKQFGKGWGEAHLRAVRQFYLIYKDIEKRYTLCSESEQPIKTNIRHTSCSKFSDVKFQTLSGELFNKVFPLSWSHYRLLMRLDEPFKREFYESECVRGNWSVRQLDRQIQSMLYGSFSFQLGKLNSPLIRGGRGCVI
ncbi:MAG: DUF1016 N-terminal domain-containing protein [Nitrospiraceae bacterium]|nr:DUF1016 N-terminal domain-containing protein [Nitrospiraceae bacterium]